MVLQALVIQCNKHNHRDMFKGNCGEGSSTQQNGEESKGEEHLKWSFKEQAQRNRKQGTCRCAAVLVVIAWDA